MKTARIFALACAPAAAMLCLAVAPRPPMASIKRCQQSLIDARNSGSAIFAPGPYLQADSCFEHLLRAWALQNSAFFLARNFDSLKLLAQRTDSLARIAKHESVGARDSMARRVPALVAETEQCLADYAARYRNLPLADTARVHFARAAIALAEGKAALASGRTQDAYARINRAHEIIRDANDAVAQTLSHYLEKAAQWRQWVAQTIAWSGKSGNTAIVVDKLAHSLRVYSCGKCIFCARAELGPQWLGQKTHCGDKATPEGRYSICRKKNQGQSKYYKALVLNYPNSQDRIAFCNLRSAGLLPPGASLGDLVEIHGSGGRGADWTNGCIALCNGDMKRLFDLAEIGTPMAIVGSVDTGNAFAHTTRTDIK
jgi:hypothetical protein